MSNLSKIETSIVLAIARKAIAAGYVITVDNGEEFPIKRSADVDKIMVEVGATDETVFIVYAPLTVRVSENVSGSTHKRVSGSTHERLGFIHFIHGNGEDVVFDCTDNDAIKALLK